MSNFQNAPETRSDIWYKDGSVVLQAGNTQFRVHWGVLSQHSSFFRDLEGLPQPSDQSTIEGCPIVELHDAVEDVKCVLTTLYDPTHLTQTALPLAELGALIRLGRKYDFKNLLDSAVVRITFENPTTLDEFQALRANGPYKPTRIAHCPGFYLDLLILIRENNIVSALPVAYFHAIKYNSLLHDGNPRVDKTPASLPSVDLRTCVLGRERLLTEQFQPGYTLGWLREWQYRDYDDPEGCSATRKSWFHSYMDGNNVGSFIQFSTPLVQQAFCTQCHRHIVESSTAGQQKTWEALPGIFDLSTWNELKNNL
ncbi:hypothetical protein K438DRAFT_1614267 [Mycena galopus ATCC 62051]|nr:hypothetical protein K438DRAFT_1614267 [Mycena galopus ATCC 62051]